MLRHPLRRWPNIGQTLGRCVVFAWYLLPIKAHCPRKTRSPMLILCWASVIDGGPTSNQHWVNALCFMDIIIQVFVSIVLWRKLLSNKMLVNVSPSLWL